LGKALIGRQKWFLVLLGETYRTVVRWLGRPSLLSLEEGRRQSH